VTDVGFFYHMLKISSSLPLTTGIAKKKKKKSAQPPLYGIEEKRVNPREKKLRRKTPMQKKVVE